MNTRPIQEVFSVIDSFAIKSRNEFYIIGEMSKGEVKSTRFINIALNKSLNITVRFKSVEDVDSINERNRYQLIILDSDPESTELLLGLNIGSELINITVDGED